MSFLKESNIKIVELMSPKIIHMDSNSIALALADDGKVYDILRLETGALVFQSVKEVSNEPRK